MISPALASITRLRRLAVILEAGDADARWLAACIREYLESAPRGATMELCFDLSPKPGDASWFETERRASRDALLAQIAAEHFPDLPPPRAAASLMAEWHQYRRHAQDADLRRGYSLAAPDTLRACLFRVAKLGDLPGERRLADILRANAEGNAA